MSILLLEGFDDNLWGSRTSGLVSGNVGSSYGLHGNGARVGSDASDELFTIPNPSSGIYTVGFAVKVVDSSSNGSIATFGVLQATVDSAYLLHDTSGSRLHLYVKGSSTADINWYSPNGSVVEGDWHYVEIQLEHGSSSDGTVKWWLDGTLLNSITTHDFAIALRTSVQFGMYKYNTDEYIDDAYIDDIYVTDDTGSNTSNLGPIEIVDLYPSGNGNSSDLVGSDSNSTDNYLLVDNNAAAPPATTEYVGSDTEGDLDTYAMDDLTGTPTVVGMVASLYAAKTDSGAKFMRPVVRTSSTDYNGDSEGLAESYSLHEHTWDQNPNTSAAWLYGAINGMEIGQEVRDS